MARIEIWARDLRDTEWPEEPLYTFGFDRGPEDVRDVRVEFYEEHPTDSPDAPPDRMWSL